MSEKRNLKRDRFKEMDQIGRHISKELDKLHGLLIGLRLFDDGGELEAFCLNYFKEKAKKKPLRAYYTAKCFDYLSVYPACSEAFQAYPECQELFQKKLPFVFELVITIQYLHNHILDEKYGAREQNHQKTVHNLISSNVLRELLFQYVESEIAPHFCDHPKELEMLVRNLRDLLLKVDIGQYLDKQYNSYQKWKGDFPQKLETYVFFDEWVHEAIDDVMHQIIDEVPGKKAFIEAYFHRIYLSNVYFFRCIAETIMGLCHYKGDQQNRFITFSVTYGFMLQIINDYADFAYSENKQEQKQLKTAGKKSTDLFADLFNFNITLPLIYHLRDQTARRKIESYLEGGIKKKHLIELYPKQIKEEIVDSGAINQTILRSLKLAEAAIDYLDPNNPHGDYFADMCDMARNNKFFQVFK